MPSGVPGWLAGGGSRSVPAVHISEEARRDCAAWMRRQSQAFGLPEHLMELLAALELEDPTSRGLTAPAEGLVHTARADR